MTGNKVGVIIPALNEEEDLPAVLDLVRTVKWLSQIVIVDDGSADSTLTVAQNIADNDPRMIVVSQASNRGKGAAMLAGVRALPPDVDTVLFLDADLSGLVPAHLEDLFKPIRSRQSDMTVAVFRHGDWRTDLAHRLTPNLSGQRCLSRVAAQRGLTPLLDSGYGVEIGLTAFARHNKWRVQYVVWRGATHVMKENKHGWWFGLKVRSSMYRQIIRTYFHTWRETPWERRTGLREINP